MSGIDLIKKERSRQITHEGYDIDHDDHYKNGELAMAACCYAAPKKILTETHTMFGIFYEDPWPWNRETDKRKTKTKIDLLVKAGALIAAEIDRLERLQNE